MFETKPAAGGRAVSADPQRYRGQDLVGHWPPGHRVPFEHELMETYSCSRMTVNKVMSALADAGLVVRRRRAGTSSRGRGCSRRSCRFPT